ncbi:MAG: SH3 domain-containing protein [Bauldia sp.]|nr:SH3 domain-containing protein [Bauldia sp.]
MRLLLAALLLSSSIGGTVAVSVSPADAAVTRTTSHLNMRFGPGANYRRVTTIPPGQTINVLGCTGNWCAATWRRHQGYVNARYLSTHKTLIVSPLYAFGQ